MLKLPAGYQVENLPSPRQIPSGPIQYSVSMAKRPNEIDSKRTFSEAGLVFDAKYYGAVRHVFDTVKSGDDQQAILEPTTTTKKQ